MTTTVKFIQNPNFLVGEYKTTEIDNRKLNAEILVKYCNGSTYTIDSKGILISGRGVKNQYSSGDYEVTRQELRRLEKKFRVYTDF